MIWIKAKEYDPKKIKLDEETLDKYKTETMLMRGIEEDGHVPVKLVRIWTDEKDEKVIKLEFERDEDDPEAYSTSDISLTFDVDITPEEKTLYDIGVSGFLE